MLLKETMSPETTLNHYGLVCGLQYERFFRKEIIYQAERALPLFRVFPDSQIAWSGPWLLSLDEDSTLVDELMKLSEKLPSVSWITSIENIDTLVIHLALQLHNPLEDGRMTLFRFYDPRVMDRVKDILTTAQREELLKGITEWRFSLNGRDFSVEP